MYVDIQGSLDCPIINDTDCSKLSSKELKDIIWKHSPHNYHQVSDWIVVGWGEDGKLKMQRTLPDGTEESAEVDDCQSMYAACSFGNGEIYKQILKDIGMTDAWHTFPPAIPRALDHRWYAYALLAGTALTGLPVMLMKSGGAEAVETGRNTAVKFYHLQRGITQPLEKGPYFIFARGGFHGRTVLSRSINSSISSQAGFWPLVPNTVPVEFGNIEELRQVLSVLSALDDLVAGVIIEPIQGEAGVIIPPKGYLKAVSDLCKRFGVPLILDEIQTGFGRTGCDFVYEKEGFMPDILILGKALGSGVAPVSAVFGRKDIMESIAEGTEGATFSGTPFQSKLLVAAVRALSNNHLSTESARKGAHMLSLFKKLQEKYPHIIVDVRGEGLFIAVETTLDGQKVSQALLDLPENKVWAKETGKHNRVIRISPHLTMREERIPVIIKSFEKALLSVAQKR